MSLPAISDCAAGQFRCTNGQCIDTKKTCDGVQDCVDLSDEIIPCSK